MKCEETNLGSGKSDAFGQLLRDEYEGRDAWEVVERDDGWISPAGSPSTYFAEYDDWPAREQQAMEAVEGRVLDIGCAAGRHAQYLQNQGHEVTGIDISPGAVDVARERGVKDVRRVNITQLSREFERDSFDTVIMMGNNFGLVGVGDTPTDVLDSLASICRPDATLVGATRDPTITDREAHVEYVQRNRDLGRLPGLFRIRVRYGTYVTDWTDHLHVSPEMMAELGTESEWQLSDTFGTDNEGDRYVGILEKTV